MAWLTQNWIWIALGIGVAYYFMRGRLGGQANGRGSRPGGMLGHMGHGRAGGPDARGTEANNSNVTTAPDAAIDPVGGGAVPTASALTSIHAGKVYYFSSKENREQFEAAPQDFAKNAAGQPMQSGAAEHRSHRGC